MSHKPLSQRELRLWHAFKVMGDSVIARVGVDIEKGAGISGAEFGVLARLQGLGRGKLRQQELADLMGWHKSRLSHQLTRMQARGYLERSPADAGGVIISITELGREVLATAVPVHAKSVREHLLDHLSSKQEDALIQISNRVTDPENED